MGKALIAIDKSKMYRVYLTISTDMVEEARQVHGTTPLATAGLGRVLTGAGLMGIMLKGQRDRLTLSFTGDGPAKQILATADAAGNVKGYITNPDVELPLTQAGKLDVGGSLGIGDLKVIKDLGLKEPYMGSIALVSGEIADDLTAYFFISEQQNSSVALGVKVARDQSVLCSGGMIIQMLPGFEEEAVDALETLLDQMKPLTTLIEEVLLQSAGKTEEGLLEALLSHIFQGIPEQYKPEPLEFREIKWQCDCSQERLEQALMTIGRKDMTEIIEEDGQAELVCQFCEKKYFFDKEHLEDILSRM
ncbi:Hsp33 family molecular chaperone HslO [Aminipila butyrica]|uniref:33 kDa chaperonin n=1 Tax=Aminipila butyrica TaxID=433296 RepID=A0A858BQI9_9FIRM|nr:Hsp33 family molecular chaperone HslO [Aminipila butyrica]QIB68131.1 Hsp33 family molecular chaperone HslO [Aminipila butyrica]